MLSVNYIRNHQFGNSATTRSIRINHSDSSYSLDDELIVYGIEEVFFRIHILRVGITGNEHGFILANAVAEIAETNLLIIIEPSFRIRREGRSLSDWLVRRIKIEQRVWTSVAFSLSEITTKDLHLLKNR